MINTSESRANSGMASDAVIRQQSTKRRSKVNSMITLAGVIMACVGGIQTATAGQEDAEAFLPAASAPYGWNLANTGDPTYEKYGPRELTDKRQLNQPIGEAAADRIARGLGLDKSKTFTEEQYDLFMSGGGNQPTPPPNFPNVPDNCPDLAFESIQILTNTIGNPLVYTDTDVNGNSIDIATVLGSYGLMVNEDGMLQSPANLAAPTRQVNGCLIPFVGYLDQWAELNGAQESIDMLRRSAYATEFFYGGLSQYEGGVAQLVRNQKPSRSAVVGMSMPPPLWNINFCLIYTLNPKLAANMPARWAPIPAPVAEAIKMASKTGQVKCPSAPKSPTSPRARGTQCPETVTRT